ncbi:MAG TPA: dihydrodipicolinate synthase family protein [Gemmatimonadales bacterium]|jgi:dihydrodipicolinate synthase/N-acetylneuraminate lyase|nr:dihydrodipicolinate synthase family protein [Gemmatimonadales bacterium]
MVIPAHPLALTARRTLDERRQRALSRYYIAAGAGGLAVGVHTTQFAIRGAGLLEPVLALAADVASTAHRRPILVAGVCGRTPQALREARLAADLGYDTALVSLAALPRATNAALLEHVAAIGEVMPVFGFYLQPAVGGRPLDYAFWRRMVEMDSVVAIKVAPFNRYETLEVMRAVQDAGAGDRVALYTGNDDHIVHDLLMSYTAARRRSVHMAGGLLGHWAFWTRNAVGLLDECRALIQRGGAVPRALLERAEQITAANGVVFDAGNHFRGCIPGIHHVLRRQGLLAGDWCLDPAERLSPGQAAAIDRVCRTWPHLTDDDFVRRHLDAWLR